MSQPTYACNEQGIALDGYDVVSYFDSGTPKRGSAKYAHDWAGATWHFASEAHRTAFTESPERYAPQAGGQCAFGASLGKDADASYESFRIIDGQLYFMKSDQVKALSKLFTGRIKKKVGQG